MPDPHPGYSMSTGSELPALTHRDRRGPASEMELTPLVSTTDGSTQQSLTPNRVSSEADVSLNTTLSAVSTAPQDAQEDAQKDASPLPHLQILQASTKSSTIRRLILDSWVCEVLAMSVSIGCLIAIVITVRFYDRKPIPQLVSGLTLNTIVSVLSTAARSGLVFVVSASVAQLKWAWVKGKTRCIQDIQLMDDASKGPLGAISLLLSWTGGLLAAFGCVITISMLTFGPFLQQILEYPLEVMTFPSRQAVASRNLLYLPADPPSSPLSHPPIRSEFVDVFETGFWSTPRPFDNTPSCPTGRCSWKAFRSVGWCTKCENRTDTAILRNCNIDASIYNSTADPEYCVLSFGSGSGSNFVLMGERPRHKPSVTVQSDPWIGPADAIMNITTEAVWTISHIGLDDLPGIHPSTVPLYGENTSFLGIRNPLMVLGHARLEYNMSSMNSQRGSEHQFLRIIEASECALTLCEKKLSVTREDRTATWTEHSTNYGHVFNRVTTYDGETEQRRNISSPCWQPTEPTAKIVTTVENATSWHDPEKPATCDVDRFWDLIGAKLSGTVKVALGVGWRFAQPGDVIGSISSETMSGNSGRLPNLSTRNFSERMGNIANALTNHGLQTSNETVLGSAISTETYVHVRWQWMVLPALLELSSLILLILSITYSRRKRVPIWKSSILAVIYHQVDGLTERGMDATERLSGMEASAKTATVELSTTSDGISIMSGKGTTRAIN